jgi:hypothetical protein
MKVELPWCDLDGLNLPDSTAQSIAGVSGRYCVSVPLRRLCSIHFTARSSLEKTAAGKLEFAPLKI